MRVKPEVGQRVRLTGEFLHNTRQIAGEGQSKWVVRLCGCGLCTGSDFVAVDQPMEQLTGPERFTGGDRHINFHNLEKCR